VQRRRLKISGIAAHRNKSVCQPSDFPFDAVIAIESRMVGGERQTESDEHHTAALRQHRCSTEAFQANESEGGDTYRCYVRYRKEAVHEQPQEQELNAKRGHQPRLPAVGKR
jgi:hypothetical protein